MEQSFGERTKATLDNTSLLFRITLFIAAFVVIYPIWILLYSVLGQFIVSRKMKTHSYTYYN